jgi:hypothetical protein
MAIHIYYPSYVGLKSEASLEQKSKTPFEKQPKGKKGWPCGSRGTALAYKLES